MGEITNREKIFQCMNMKMYNDRKKIKVKPISTITPFQNPAQKLLKKSFYDGQSMIKLEGKQGNLKIPTFFQAIQTSDGQSMCMGWIRGHGWWNGFQVKESEFRLDTKKKPPCEGHEALAQAGMRWSLKPLPAQIIPWWHDYPLFYLLLWCHFKHPTIKPSEQRSSIVLILFPLKTPWNLINISRSLTGTERRVGSQLFPAEALCFSKILWNLKTFSQHTPKRVNWLFLVTLPSYKSCIPLFSCEFWTTNSLKGCNTSEEHHIYTNRFDFLSLYQNPDFVAFQVIWGFARSFVSSRAGVYSQGW